MKGKVAFGLGCMVGAFVATIVIGVILFFSLEPLVNLLGAGKAETATASPDPTAVRKELGHASAPKPKELIITRAQYGADNVWIDVTRQVRDRISDNTLSVPASNGLAGDPLYGKMKTLKVEYILDGQKKSVSIPEGGYLEIPGLAPITAVEDLMAFIKRCPAEVGFFAMDFTTGRTVEHRPDQPACMASIVKLFTLLEVMSQVQGGRLNLDDDLRIKRKKVTIKEALDLMIGLSDNDATDALTARVGYDRVNALPGELGMTGVSDQILPKPGVLDGVLDQRVSGPRVVSTNRLLPQHATARGMLRYFELLDRDKLKSPEISTNVVAVLDRHPRGFVPNAPAGFKVVGKGGSLGWKRPGKPQYNMLGWNLYLRDGKRSLALCLWCEWFPENMTEELKTKWCFAISDGIVAVLLNNETRKDIPR